MVQGSGVLTKYAKRLAGLGHRHDRGDVENIVAATFLPAHLCHGEWVLLFGHELRPTQQADSHVFN